MIIHSERTTQCNAFACLLLGNIQTVGTELNLRCSIYYFPVFYKKEKYIILNVFDNIRDKVLSLFNQNGWIKWIHEGTMRAYDNEDKKSNIIYASKSNHCAKCLNMNGCCFPRNNMPNYPLHYNCHCWLMPVNNIHFEATSTNEKFTINIFNPTETNGKIVLFESLGYDKMDYEMLIDLYCKQAKEKYSNGDFILGKLDNFGQRINIVIALPSKDGSRIKYVKSAWMVYPDGKIKLITADGGKVK